MLSFHMSEGDRWGNQHLAGGVVFNLCKVLVPLVTSQWADFKVCVF